MCKLFLRTNSLGAIVVLKTLDSVQTNYENHAADKKKKRKKSILRLLNFLLSIWCVHLYGEKNMYR